MKFRDLLNEKWKTSFIYAYSDETIEIFVNPTKREIMDIHKSSAKGQRDSSARVGSQNVRYGISDEKVPKLYAWPSHVLHYITHTYIKFDFGFVLETPTKITSYEDSFSELKNRKQIVDLIKKNFPKVTVILSESDHPMRYSIKKGKFY